MSLTDEGVAAEGRDAGSATRYDVVIVGAGAAGLTAAIFAGREARRRAIQPRIVALEGARQIGAKILISGGTRCNVTHDVVRPEDFYGGNRNLVARVLRTFSVEKTIEFFRELGVNLKREETGKLFPVSDRSRDVVDALVHAVSDAGVALHSGKRVENVTRSGGEVTIKLAGAEPIVTRRLILATGGLSLPKSGSDGGGYVLARAFGHSLTTTTPALVPLLLPADHWLTSLSGIAVEVELRLLEKNGKVRHRDRGSMLLTHFGLSGPVVLDISRHWIAARDEVTLAINFAAGVSFEAVEAELQADAQARPRAALQSWLVEHLPERLALALLDALGLERTTMLGQLSREGRRTLLHGLTSYPLPIRGDRGYNYAEVTAGGIPLEEIEIGTMRSRFAPELYLCGEVLDVDGRIGGYNFQWAWASGRLAGISAVAGLDG